MRHRDGASQIPAIPDDNAPLPPARRPTRWNVRRGRAIAFCLLGLALAASLLSVYLTYGAAEQSARQAEAVDRRLTVLEQDLSDRTRQRDAERDAAQDADAEFRARFCEVLMELSATFPNLDQLEAALNCPAPTGVESPPAAQPAPRTATPGPDAPAPAHTPTPAPAPSSPTAPSSQPGDPPADPGLVCGLLPALC